MINRFHNRSDPTEKRISELEDRSGKTFQNVTQRQKKGWKIQKHKRRKDTIPIYHMLIRVQKERRNRAGTIYENTTTENFTELIKYKHKIKRSNESQAGKIKKSKVYYLPTLGDIWVGVTFLICLLHNFDF